MIQSSNTFHKSTNVNKFDNISILQDKRILGFWIYLISDCILFATMFSVYCVMHNNIIIHKNFFNLKLIFCETIVLLFSSIFYGLMSISVEYKRSFLVYVFLFLSFICGIFFISMEFYEFNHLINLGYFPTKNGFLSSFFTLIGLHGIHVIIGLLWMLIMYFQILMVKLNQDIYVKVLCLGLFWHFLDIIWICLFTIVYLIGSI